MKVGVITPKIVNRVEFEAVDTEFPDAKWYSTAREIWTEEQPFEVCKICESLEKFDYNVSAVLVISGNPNATWHMIKNKQVHNILNEMYSRGKVVACICCSVGTLAYTNFIRNVRITCFPWSLILEVLYKSGACIVDDLVVADKRVVTAQTQIQSYAWCEKIKEEVKKGGKSRNVE